MTKESTKNYKLLLILPLVFLLGACGQDAFQVKKLSEQVESSTSELNKLANEVDMQSNDLDQLIYEIENDPTIQDIENHAEPSLSDLGEVKGIIEDGLKPIFGKIGDFYNKLENLKKRIENQIGVLDPNNPDHQKLISRLKDLVDKIEDLQNKVQDLVDRLKDKLLNLDQIFDRLLDKLDGSEFWHIPARMIVEEIRDMIMDKVDELIGVLP